MVYSIEFSTLAKNQIKKLEKSVQKRMTNVLKRIQIRPESHKIKKLIGLPFFRIRVGKYRIILILDLNTKKIKIIRIGHRKDVYKKLEWK